jgi:hypothetical protein
MVDKMARSGGTSIKKGDHPAGSELGYQSNTICVVRGVFRKLEIVASFDFESSELVQQLAPTANRKKMIGHFTFIQYYSEPCYFLKNLRPFAIGDQSSICCQDQVMISNTLG